MGRKSGLKLSIFTCLDFTHPKPNPKKKFLPKTKTPNASKLTQQRSQQVKAFSKNIKPVYLHTHPNQIPTIRNSCPKHNPNPYTFNQANTNKLMP